MLSAPQINPAPIGIRIFVDRIRLALLPGIFFLILLNGCSKPSEPFSREPYLQSLTMTSVVVRWNSALISMSQVQFGTDPSNLSMTAGPGARQLSHQVEITGLAPQTKYYYRVWSQNPFKVETNQYFTTAPLKDSSSPVRAWFLGDAGTQSPAQLAVRDSYLRFAGERHADLMMMLGDNAYKDGTEKEFQQGLFDIYDPVLRHTPLWVTIGNHDVSDSWPRGQTGPYYDLFSMPQHGQAGGVPSDSESFYSFNYGPIHFVSLDSFSSDRAPEGKMLQWLQSDLESNRQNWTICFWHHPPYSRGEHHSDLKKEKWSREMRMHALPIIERFGVDLVVNGHSHSYERSCLLKGHYGPSATLSDTMILDASDGRLDHEGAYRKSDRPRSPGTIYVVAGSAGGVTSGALNHPAMKVSLAVPGSLIVDIQDKELNALFLDHQGVRQDYFTIIKQGADLRVPNLASNYLKQKSNSKKSDEP